MAPQVLGYGAVGDVHRMVDSLISSEYYGGECVGCTAGDLPIGVDLEHWGSDWSHFSALYRHWDWLDLSVLEHKA